MNILDNYTKLVLQTFNNHKVEYLVVGGYAVNFYGYRRTTGDIDIWMKPDNGINKSKILNALSSLGIDDDSIDYLKNLNFTTPIVFSDGEVPFKIDFMTFLAGKIDFELAYQAKINAKFDEVDIPFINYRDLITSKITSDRLKDKLDVETLQNIHKQQ